MRLTMKQIILFLAFILIAQVAHSQTWAEKLGFPSGKKVLILHADDIGMCPEANEAVFSQLSNNEIQSAAAMVPCPAFADLVQWTKDHTQYDIGLHLTLTSEWQTYRWGPVADRDRVPGLLDEDGKLWHSVRQVVTHANAREVEEEIRAQIEKSISMGLRPSHIDTHMGTLYGDNDYTEAYMRVAQEYKIPAMVIEISSPEIVQKFRQAGYPITERLIKLVKDYKLPKLDYFTSVPSASSYDEKIAAFFKLIDELPPGLTEIIFHPSVDSPRLKSITNSWQQRVWEAAMFADPKVQKYLQQNDIIFTNWKDIMTRYRG